MNKLLLVIPVSANDAVLAERMIDHTFSVNGRVKSGHALLAFYDVHDELKLKVKIAAEVAFETVTAIEVPRIESREQLGKNQYANHLFRHAAQWVQKHSRWPFLWLEADCVPLKPDWMEALADAYDAQPLRHMGNHMKSGDKIFMARVGVYHPAVFSEVDRYCDEPVPCNVAADTVARCTKTRLIQSIPIRDAEDVKKIWPECVLAHGDKLGILTERAESDAQAPSHEAIAQLSQVVESVNQITTDFLIKSANEEIALDDVKARMAKARAARKPKQAEPVNA